MPANMTDEINDRIRALVPDAFKERVPPPVLRELQGRMRDYVPGKSLTAVFPPQPRFSNVVGSVQGGILTAALDGVMGCLAFLECEKPCTSITIETSFVKPVAMDQGDFSIVAAWRTRTTTMAFVTGEVFNPAGDICAISAMTMRILDPDRLAR